MKALSVSLKTYLALIAFLAAVKIVFLLFPTTFPLEEQESAFYWTTISIIALMGFVGFALARRTGFPEIWDARVSNKQRFLIPAVIGLVYGFITVLKDLSAPADIHLRLPLSIPFYAYGAVFLEIMLRLFALPFLVWLISNLILRGRWQTVVVWFAVIVAALYEPSMYLEKQLASASGFAVVLVLLKWLIEPLFLANVVTGWLFRKYGFLAAVIMRLSFYLVWHIIYGGLISAAASVP
jgi:hypothetical protein